MKIRMTAILLAAVMLCGCSASREAELQSEIDDLKSQLDDLDEKTSSGSDGEDSDKSESPSDGSKPSTGDSTYDGINWDNIPEAPASDFGYRLYCGPIAEDMEYMAGYMGDGSEIINSILIFDYYGHDKYVKIPKEIDGLPVTNLGTIEPGEGYYTKPWTAPMLDPECKWVDVQWDNSVFRDTNVENIFIPEHLRGIAYTAFDDCPTLKSISVDPNNLAYFSEDGVLFCDENVESGNSKSSKAYVYTRLPKYTYGSADPDQVNMQDEGEWVMKTPDCKFYSIYYTDSGLSKFALSDYNVVKFTDGTYGAYDQVTGKYIPIDAGQFKRGTRQTLFRYPEGKRDKSYTVKKRTSMSFDENGNEEFHDDYGCFYSQIGGVTLAFSNVKYLKKLEFEDGVVSITETISQGEGNSIPIGVEKITIPASIVSLGDIMGEKKGYFGSFSGLTNLKEYEVDKNNPIFKSVDGALLSKDGKILYSMPCKIGKNYTVPDGVEIIASRAFSNTRDMTITIPASVKYLGIYSMDKIPDSSKNINYSPDVFGDSSNITFNVSSKTEIRDIFEGMPETCEARMLCTGLTVNFVD